ncbi:DMT family transporter [Desulfobacterota bacterium AH_259_B03_O07]|nr:DMT family transporter [Desulfobacterota bacterium AH_259_B03_O07]
MKISGIDLALLTFAIITWGYSWVLMKLGLQYAEPLTFATWRCAIGGLAMIPILYMKAASLLKGRKWFDYIMVGLFQTTAMFGFMLYGMKFVTAGKSAVLLYTMSIWTSLLVHFYLKERLNVSQWLGVLSGCVGILFMLGWDTLINQNKEIIFGEVLILIGAISWALANIWVKKNMNSEDVYVVSGLQLLIGAAGLGLLTIPTEGILNFEWTPHSIYILLFTAIISSAIDFTIWFYLLKKININTATFSSMLVPVFGLIFDWMVLGTKLDPGIVVGGLLILSGIYQVSREKS